MLNLETLVFVDCTNNQIIGCGALLGEGVGAIMHN